jgi:hypothetical protein
VLIYFWPALTGKMNYWIERVLDTKERYVEPGRFRIPAPEDKGHAKRHHLPRRLQISDILLCADAKGTHIAFRSPLRIHPPDWSLTDLRDVVAFGLESKGKDRAYRATQAVPCTSVANR